ncbi:hypothetical protein AB6A40_007905 [Gnathostoma spinigerum]|uniref:NVL2 nucleolin binding domain-containing protein n=1 Tax=Gnathostoma spinigerum TaxID=75299 RepID=A0ABD6EPJ4_9BILA
MDGYRNRGFVSDPRLIPRIKEVLESFCDDLLEPEDVAQHLKNRYPEYGRKKLRDFTRMVEAGMNKIDVNNTSVTSLKDRKRRIMSEKRDVVTVNCESDGSDDDSSRYDQNETTNSANKWLYNMYSKRGSEVISQISESKNKKTSKGAKRIARDSKVVDGPRKSPTFEFTVQKSTIKFENLGGCEAQFLVR